MIFLDHSLEIASYEGVRVAVNFDSTNASVLSRCNEIINERHVVGATVGINPSDVSHVNRGDHITISVSAPCTSNALLPPWFYGGKKLTCSATMVKE